MAAHHEARVWAVIGATGTGKGLWVKSQLRKLAPGRLAIFDPMNEYGGHASAVNLPAAIAAMKAPRFRLRIVPAGDDAQRAAMFDLFCRACYAAGNLTCLVEELSLWTTPSSAPPAWRDLCNTGRHKGLAVIGTSQYPAQVDKAFLGAATLIHCCALRQDRHRRAVAAEMDIDPDELRDLPDLAFIERDMRTGAMTRGSVKAPRSKAASAA